MNKEKDYFDKTKDHFKYDIDHTPDDELFDLGREVFAIRRAIKENPQKLEELLKVVEGDIEEKLARLDYCPECGKKMEWQYDSRLDTRAPYGDTTIKESDGGYMICPSCGHKGE